MMATAHFELNATVRENIGKGASRRLRREQNQFPAIVYGGKEKPQSIMLDHQKMLHALENEGFYSHILTLNVDGKKEQVVLKALQRHHYRKALLHADFFRVKATDKIHMRIPLHFLNEDTCPGVKAGGLLNHQAIDVEIRCQANQLPEFIEVDLSGLELDHSIHLSNLKLAKGIELTALSHDNDLALVSVHMPRISQEDAATEAAEEAAAAEAAAAAVPTVEKGKAATADATAAKPEAEKTDKADKKK